MYPYFTAGSLCVPRPPNGFLTKSLLFLVRYIPVVDNGLDNTLMICSNLFFQRSKWKPRNTESCGELWLGFLRYYTEEFDYRRNVVCVRYLKPLTKFEKLWNGRLMCIEGTFA